LKAFNILISSTLSLKIPSFSLKIIIYCKIAFIPTHKGWGFLARRYKLAKKYDSAIVALWFKPSSIKSLKIKHNLPKKDITDPKEFHVTMMYLGDLVDIKKDKAVIEKALQILVNKYENFEITLGGVAKFFTNEDKDPIVFTINSPEIEKLRNEIVSVMESIGIKENKPFGFIPHLTLAFTDSENIGDISLENDTLEVSGLCLSWGGNLKHFDFKA
jgi:2'-5' RNA ligase